MQNTEGRATPFWQHAYSLLFSAVQRDSGGRPRTAPHLHAAPYTAVSTLVAAHEANHPAEVEPPTRAAAPERLSTDIFCWRMETEIVAHIGRAMTRLPDFMAEHFTRLGPFSVKRVRSPDDLLGHGRNGWSAVSWLNKLHTAASHGGAERVLLLERLVGVDALERRLLRIFEEESKGIDAALHAAGAELGPRTQRAWVKHLKALARDPASALDGAARGLLDVHLKAIASTMCQGPQSRSGLLSARQGRRLLRDRAGFCAPAWHALADAFPWVAAGDAAGRLEAALAETRGALIDPRQGLLADARALHGFALGLLEEIAQSVRRAPR